MLALPMGGAAYLGIDIGLALSLMPVFSVKKRDRRTVLENLQEMERIALPLLNERD